MEHITSLNSENLIPTTEKSNIEKPNSIKVIFNSSLSSVKKSLQYIHTYFKNPLNLAKTFSITFALTIIVLLSVVYTNAPVNKNTSNKLNIYTSKPLVLGASSQNIVGQDARPEILKAVFAQYNCPLLGTEHKIVQEADKNNIPYWLIPAVSFQESSCGKKTPEKEGVESYNAWGWGVWGNNVKFFNSFDHGIEVVSKYFSQNFHDKGVTDLCTIMKTYTPPSKGSWCEGVGFYRDVILNYER